MTCVMPVSSGSPCSRRSSTPVVMKTWMCEPRTRMSAPAQCSDVRVVEIASCDRGPSRVVCLSARPFVRACVCARARVCKHTGVDHQLRPRAESLLESYLIPSDATVKQLQVPREYPGSTPVCPHPFRPRQPHTSTRSGRDSLRMDDIRMDFIRILRLRAHPTDPPMGSPRSSATRSATPARAHPRGNG